MILVEVFGVGVGGLVVRVASCSVMESILDERSSNLYALVGAMGGK